MFLSLFNTKKNFSYFLFSFQTIMSNVPSGSKAKPTVTTPIPKVSRPPLPPTTFPSTTVTLQTSGVTPPQNNLTSLTSGGLSVTTSANNPGPSIPNVSRSNSVNLPMSSSLQTSFNTFVPPAYANSATITDPLALQSNLSGQPRISHFEVPQINRPPIPQARKNSSSSSEEEISDFSKKPKKSKKAKKAKKKKPVSSSSEVSSSSDSSSSEDSSPRRKRGKFFHYLE